MGVIKAQMMHIFLFSFFGKVIFKIKLNYKEDLQNTLSDDLFSCPTLVNSNIWEVWVTKENGAFFRT